MGSDGTAEFADPDSFPRLFQTFDCSPELAVHERHLQTEGDRFGVDAVTPTNHWRVFVGDGLPGDRFPKIAEILQEYAARGIHLHRDRGVQNVGRC